MKHTGPLEIEIKLPIPSLEGFPSRLRAAGFLPSHPQSPETSVLWDHEGLLRAEGAALRLRRYGSTATLTWKGPRQPDPRLKIRPEVETVVEDFEAMAAILGALGFAPVLTMTKSRSLWLRDELEACLDEAPFGCFLELEGSAQAIEQAVIDLSLTGVAPELRSYPTLFLEQS